MNGPERLNLLIREFIKPELKKHGFTLKGRTFYVFDSGNWGLIEIQNGTRSTQDAIAFTINVGIACRRFSGLSDDEWRRTRPPMYRADYNLRLGFLLGLPTGRKDKWWTLEAQTDLSSLAEELLGHLRGAAIPEIRRLISDEGLRDYWLSGQGGGLSERQRLSKLETLLRAIGPVERLAKLNSDTAVDVDREFGDLVTGVLRAAGFSPYPTRPESGTSSPERDPGETDPKH